MVEDATTGRRIRLRRDAPDGADAAPAAVRVTDAIEWAVQVRVAATRADEMVVEIAAAMSVWSAEGWAELLNRPELSGWRVEEFEAW
jgi:hypothetical protein